MPKIITKRIELHVYRESNAGYEYLLLKRSAEGKYPSLWQMVSGTIDEGESSYETAIRELKEETHLEAEELFIFPRVSEFYDFFEEDTINLVPVFITKVSNDEVRISDEHSEYKWVNFSEAYKTLDRIQWKENSSLLEKILNDKSLFSALQKIEIKK
jgi:dATP pyrophosphohydrolase